MILRCGLLVIFFLIPCTVLFGQDGSDMRYLKPSDLNDSYIGRFVHLDFGTRSFSYAHGPKLGDKVTVEIDDKKIIFVEHREDDGYNNWFQDQYLESATPIANLKLRLTKNKLLDIKGDSIKVLSYFDFVSSTGKIVDGKSFTKELTFPKNQIAEVLVWSHSQ